eukprot:m.266068 g.266068  ORF g.266068 m.266068 type:complete len:616 (-) comp22791_c1_seq7:112-1959(-)
MDRSGYEPLDGDTSYAEAESPGATLVGVVGKHVRNTFPILKWAPHYNLQTLRGDVIAGLTVGLMVVPQALAYASVAGFKLNPQYGLYSSVAGPFIYCILGTSKDITLGPTAIMCLLVSNVAAADTSSGLGDIHKAVLLSILSGLIQLAMGILRLGMIVEFISIPVISGFTSAAAITIGMGQVKHILGEGSVRRPFLQCVQDTFQKIGETRTWDLVMGLCCIVLLLCLQKLKTKYGNGSSMLSRTLWLMGTARNAVLAIIAGLVGYAVKSSRHSNALLLVGHFPGGLPPFESPGLTSSDFSSLGSTAVVVALIGFLESIAIGKAFARQNAYEIDASQELIAIGTTNIFSSFIKAFPATGSFSRTAVNAQSGVRTPAGGILTGMVVLFALRFLTEYFQYIPESALGAIIITAVAHMFDYKIVIRMWHLSRWDLVPWTVSFVLCLCLDIQYGVTSAVGLCILFLLYKAARPNHEKMVLMDATDHFVDVDIEALDEQPEGCMLRFGSNLLFPAMGGIKDTVTSAVKKSNCRAFFFDFVNVHIVDFSGCQSLLELAQSLQRGNVRPIFFNVRPKVQELLEHAGVTAHARIYSSETAAIQAARLYPEFETSAAALQKIPMN